MNVTRVRPLQGREWRQGTYDVPLRNAGRNLASRQDGITAGVAAAAVAAAFARDERWFARGWFRFSTPRLMPSVDGWPGFDLRSVDLGALTPLTAL